MLEFDARKLMSAASVSAVAVPLGFGGPRQLSPEAQKVAEEPIAPAFSPIVVAGFVRIIDAVGIAAIGMAIYLAHVFPVYGFAAYYVTANVTIAALAVLAFHASDLFDVAAF